MKCFFCKQSIPYDRIHQSKNFLSLRIADCSYCKNDTIYTTMVTDDDKLVSAHLYVKWREKRYQFLFHFKDNYFAIIHLTSTNKIYGQYDEIYKSEEIPDITFDNVLSKLETILTFL